MDHVVEYLLAYLENRLDAETRLWVDAHLAECESCQAELAATQQLVASLAEAGRTLQKLPVNLPRGWATVRERWQSPLVSGVRDVSQRLYRRLSWQASVSVAVVAMALVSGMSINSVGAAALDLPAIQTPNAPLAVNSDTPTLSATQAATVSLTPTETLTLTLSPTK